MLQPFPVICHETTSLFPVPLFPFLFFICFFIFPLCLFLPVSLLCFLCLSPSLRGWCDEWDECKHMCGVYDGLLTGRSYLLCSAPVVLWLQLTAWILDKRADIKEYSGEEQSSSLSIPPAARTHVNAVGGGSDIRRFLWQSQARQERLRQFCGRLPLGKLWYHISPHTSSHRRAFSCIALICLSLSPEINSILLIMHWQHCSPCQRAIVFEIQSLIGVWESGGPTGGGGTGDLHAEVLSLESDGALVQMTSQHRAQKVWREAQVSYRDREERHTEPVEAVA